MASRIVQLGDLPDIYRPNRAVCFNQNDSRSVSGKGRQCNRQAASKWPVSVPVTPSHRLTFATAAALHG